MHRILILGYMEKAGEGLLEYMVVTVYVEGDRVRSSVRFGSVSFPITLLTFGFENSSEVHSLERFQITRT